jgi:hypothetical protein
MAEFHTQQIEQLARGISALDRAMQEWNPAEIQELIKIIRLPGWTTPAEILFALGIVQSLVAQATAFNQLRNALLQGSRTVRAN